ncbi:DUF3379 family protein [Alteromonas sp. ASW11-36]|uniref:DUF3379 family protein n=1 Tax=Alteromonas arenosi TaxID=3055817 RepID=A0ABT7SWS2_9ALTE|nr:DUF3379 family protein [Alteromonas sp. ASW11-36]MDM7859997.1 DUF3379 family protein [Alteromonas sp. ASW11-36]
MSVDSRPMDELAFRRSLYAEPHSTDPQIKAAATSSERNRAFAEELLRLDAAISAASKVPVPEGLASRIIWQGSISEFALHKKRTRTYIALAASLAFVTGLSVVVWQQQTSTIDLTAEALAHMNHVEGYRGSTVSLAETNGKLAAFGAALISDIGVIKSANFCWLDKVRSLHLIVETTSGLVSVFFVPDVDGSEFGQRFSNQQFVGEKLTTEKAQVLMIGEQGQDLHELSEKINNNLVFSA